MAGPETLSKTTEELPGQKRDKLRKELEDLDRLWKETLDRLDDNEHEEVMKVTNTTEVNEVELYLKESGSKLSDPAKFFLRISIDIKKRKKELADLGFTE